MRQRLYTVGLTGGIGCGKSSVGELFSAFGAAVLDTDDITRSLLEWDDQISEDIRAALGEEVMCDDRPSRRRLRQRIFREATAKTALESILHPRILQTARQRLAGLAAGQAPYAILVVPLLFEAGWQQYTDRVLVVDCAADTQRARVMARSHLTAAEVEAIIHSQLPRAQRLARADDILSNEGTRSELKPRVALLHTQYCQLAMPLNT